jgi:hypothetical protein
MTDANNLITLGARQPDPSNKALITTRTGEPYQPTRIYYQVSNPKTVIGAFKKLRCMQFEPRLNDAWRWLYDEETRKLKFEVSYNKIPKEYRPIVLGDFYFRENQEMILDVRSFDRAIKAIEFFDKRLNRRAAEVTKIRVVNKYFDGNAQLDQSYLQPPFDLFFDREDIAIPDPQELEQQLMQIKETVDDQESQIQAFNALMEEKSKEPLPEVEEIPVHFYEDGIGPLQMALTMRSIEAMQHWQGNTAFRQYDLIQQMAASLPNDFLLDDLEDEDLFDEADADIDTDAKS